MSVGGMVFNPLVPNELWFPTASAFGPRRICRRRTLQSNTPVIWNDQSVGIEQLVANEIIVPPGGDPVLASWDRAILLHKQSQRLSLDLWPSRRADEHRCRLVCRLCLVEPELSGRDCRLVGHEESGYSTNGGQTWTPFPSFIPGAGTSFIGGTIAASSPTNIIWAPAGGIDPYYTLNGGKTWNPITLPGVSSWSGFDSAYYLDTQNGHRRPCAAEYVLSVLCRSMESYETTNGGVTWTKSIADNLTLVRRINAELQSVPGEAGNLFFTGGPQQRLLSQTDDGFYQSTNGGATWTAVPNVSEVICFGFGAPAPGQSYPSIYIVGWVNNVYGIWQSTNNAQSWTQIGTYPNGSLDQIKTISGDPNIYGQVYVGFAGTGYAYLPATACRHRCRSLAIKRRSEMPATPSR